MKKSESANLALVNLATQWLSCSNSQLSNPLIISFLHQVPLKKGINLSKGNLRLFQRTCRWYSSVEKISWVWGTLHDPSPPRFLTDLTSRHFFLLSDKNTLLMRISSIELDRCTGLLIRKVMRKYFTLDKYDKIWKHQVILHPKLKQIHSPYLHKSTGNSTEIREDPPLWILHLLSFFSNDRDLYNSLLVIFLLIYLDSVSILSQDFLLHIWI